MEGNGHGEERRSEEDQGQQDLGVGGSWRRGGRQWW